MAKTPKLTFWTDAYLTDTLHLSTEEHGAYFLLLLAAWQQKSCSLPNNDRKLAAVCRMSTRKWNQIKDTILEFWTVEDGRIYNSKLSKERAYYDKICTAKSKNLEGLSAKQPIENKQSDHSARESYRADPYYLLPRDKKEIDKSISKKAENRVVEESEFPVDWFPKFCSPKSDSRKIESRWDDKQREKIFQDFKKYHVGHKSRFKDWQRAWGTWVLNAERFNRGKSNNGWQQPDKRTGFAQAIDADLERIESSKHDGSGTDQKLKRVGGGASGGNVIAIGAGQQGKIW